MHSMLILHSPKSKYIVLMLVSHFYVRTCFTFYSNYNYIVKTDKVNPANMERSYNYVKEFRR